MSLYVVHGIKISTVELRDILIQKADENPNIFPFYHRMKNSVYGYNKKYSLSYILQDFERHVNLEYPDANSYTAFTGFLDQTGPEVVFGIKLHEIEVDYYDADADLTIIPGFGENITELGNYDIEDEERGEIDLISEVKVSALQYMISYIDMNFEDIKTYCVENCNF